MSVKRMLCASSIAVGLGLGSLLGAAAASADPGPNPPSIPSIPSNVKLNHHQRKLLKEGEQELPQQLPAGVPHV